MLNAALYPERNGWQPISAKKRNVDLFGQDIRPGQACFIRQVGMGYADVERVTEDSMNRLLDAVFLGNPRLAEFARAAAKSAQDRQRQDLERAVLGHTTAGPT